MRDELIRKFRQHNVNLDTAFSAFDRNNDGWISNGEMRDGLRQLNINLSLSEIDDVVRMMDRNNDGRIDYREFAREFGSSIGAGSSSYPASSNRPGQHTLSRGVIDDLKQKFRQHNVDLHQAFSAFDGNGDGVIDRHEMRRGLNALSVRLTERDIDDIINHFDNDGNGRIEYSEFIRQFDGRRDNSRQSTLSREVIDTLKFKFRDHNVNVEQAFSAFDRDGDGNISPHEFRSGLAALNIHVDYRQLNEVLDHFDRDGRGEIQYRDFVRQFGNGNGQGRDDVRSSRDS